LREGEVGTGDGIERVGRDRNNITVPDITRLYVNKHYSQADLEMLRRATALEALPESWRSYFAEKLQLITRKSPPA
jgi:MOSC domain-containing protein YiiM